MKNPPFSVVSGVLSVRRCACASYVSSLVMLLFCCGCSAEFLGLRFGITKGTVVPTPPAKTVTQTEDIRKAAALVSDIVARVESIGAPAHAPAVQQAALAAQVVSDEVGAPGKRLDLPPSGKWDVIPEFHNLLAEVQKERADYAEQFAKWQAQIDALSKQPQKTSYDLSLRTIWPALVGVAVLVFAIWMLGRAFTQTVAGAEILKDTAPTPAAVAATLAGQQSWFTKVLVGVVKWIARV